LDNEINSTRLNFTSISLSSATPVSNFHTFSFYFVHSSHSHFPCLLVHCVCHVSSVAPGN